MMGGKNSMVRMRGSRKACRNSLRMISISRSRISSHLLSHLSRRGPKDQSRVHNQHAHFAPQNPDAHAFQENSVQNGDEIARRNNEADGLNHFRHVLYGPDKSGEQIARKE